MAEKTKKTDIDLKALKAGGLIKERGKDLFTIRLRVPGGRMSIPRLRKILEVAEKHGGDFVHLSVRQSLEIVHVNLNDVSEAMAELDLEGQKPASCGARVRVPVACGGCEYNPNGLVDTQKSASELDSKLFGTETGHHKFKVAFAGCPIDCPKSATNDVGFQGAVWPKLHGNACLGCGLCIRSCSAGAIRLGKDERPVFEPEKCVYCGDCVKICPAEAWKEEKRGYTVRIGGRWGKNPLIGTLFARFLPEHMVVDFVTEVLKWYVENAEGLGRIRIGDVLRQKGVDGLLDHLWPKFPDHVVQKTIPPQPVDTQTGEQPYSV